MSYQIKVRQHPKQGRMSGFSKDKDRRKIEPPLVLQLLYQNSDGTVDTTGSALEAQVFLCHITLVMVNGSSSASTVVYSPLTGPRAVRRQGTPVSARYTTNELFHTLLGARTIMPEKLADLNSEMGFFFVFGDLAIRCRGRFRIKVQLICPLDQSQILHTVWTDPFTIYSPNTFPGVLDATALSRCLAHAGADLHFRNVDERVKPNAPRAPISQPIFSVVFSPPQPKLPKPKKAIPLKNMSSDPPPPDDTLT